MVLEVTRQFDDFICIRVMLPYVIEPVSCFTAVMKLHLDSFQKDCDNFLLNGILKYIVCHFTADISTSLKELNLAGDSKGLLIVYVVLCKSV